MTTDPIITIDDVRAGGNCVRGARGWFDYYGLDFRLFLKEGLPASVLLATGDAMAIRVVKRKLDGQA